MSALSMAQTDALDTARLQLEVERRALRYCDAKGWTWDAFQCRQNITRLEAVVTAIEAKEQR